METIVETTIPADQFVLADTIDRVPDVEFECVRSAIHSSESAMPFVWASTNQPDRLTAALRDDRSTERVTHLSMSGGRSLYSVEWTEPAASRIEDFAETSGLVLDVRGTAEQWTVQTLFPDRGTASATFEAWCAAGIDPSLSRIRDLSYREDDVPGLSATQHSTIAKAFETDYYSVPRGTTLGELAANFEVSHQALSERLRRGHANLVERMLSESPVAVAHRP